MDHDEPTGEVLDASTLARLRRPPPLTPRPQISIPVHRAFRVNRWLGDRAEADDS